MRSYSQMCRDAEVGECETGHVTDRGWKELLRRRLLGISLPSRHPIESRALFETLCDLSESGRPQSSLERYSRNLSLWLVICHRPQEARRFNTKGSPESSASFRILWSTAQSPLCQARRLQPRIHVRQRNESGLYLFGRLPSVRYPHIYMFRQRFLRPMVSHRWQLCPRYR